MKYGYIGQIGLAQEFNHHVTLFKQNGVTLDNMVINIAFDEFIESMKDGDTVVVYSYVGPFTSLHSYMTTATEMLERGVMIESIQEPDICINSSNCGLISQLNALNRKLRYSSSIKIINKLKQEGKRIGRPRGTSPDLLQKVAQVEILHSESDISIVKACKQVGCSLKTYYRLKDKK